MTKYTKASPPAKKMSLFSFIIITIILSYAIVRIYITLHIYLQVSETQEGGGGGWRGLEGRWGGGGRTALEKINSIHSHGISLAFPRMFF